ncbi:MAG: hypothetical protein M5U34_38525 [Chloroflexi bacterium]|nr:hypothetical protein [Chloroflexota bacterium]
MGCAFGRLYRDDDISLISNDTCFQLADKIVIAGTLEEMDKVEADFGQRSAEDLLHDRAVYASRRLLCPTRILPARN